MWTPDQYSRVLVEHLVPTVSSLIRCLFHLHGHSNVRSCGSLCSFSDECASEVVGSVTDTRDLPINHGKKCLHGVHIVHRGLDAGTGLGLSTQTL